ncbi:MAG: hypothetical protein BWZ02_00652 [Lentisphaerae bacterium ADurb.BinA184]|nr:MAG: hypothetical protein BWZ02_00652 [Lentisphaerae bacterium ADurb.BinA184]
MRESVYIETSVVSLLTARPSRDLIVAAMQQATQEWWETRRLGYDCYVSNLVMAEIRAGDDEAASRRVSAVGDMPVLAAVSESERLARELMRRTGLPDGVTDDVAHISVATVYGMAYLLTWNCAHIANPHWVPKLAAIALDLGYAMPTICTPQALLEGDSL